MCNTADLTLLMLTETSLTADWALQIVLTVLGYVLLGSVKSLNSILPTPGLDCSTSPGGQTHLLCAISGSLTPLQAALWLRCKMGEYCTCRYWYLWVFQRPSPIPNRYSGTGTLHLWVIPWVTCCAWVPLSEDGWYHYQYPWYPWYSLIQVWLHLLIMTGLAILFHVYADMHYNYGLYMHYDCALHSNTSWYTLI